MSPATRVRAYLSIVRPINCVMIGLAVVVGEAISLGSTPPLGTAAYGFLTAALMMGGTMILNDIQDVEIDRVNNPDRPIPSGKVNTQVAYYFVVGLSLLSLIFASLLGLDSLLVALLALGLMAYYNTRGKKSGFPGNVVVSFNVALPFVFGGISVGVFRPIVVLFSLLAFLSNLGREVLKGITDVQGDKEHRVQTVAVLKGPRLAALLGGLLFVISVVVSLVPPILGIVSVWYLPVVLFSDAGFLTSSILLVRNSSADNARKVKSYVLLSMLFGLIAFLVGGLS